VTFQSEDLSNKYTPDQYAQKYTVWQQLMQSTFIK
jgi:hypothetical protein